MTQWRRRFLSSGLILLLWSGLHMAGCQLGDESSIPTMAETISVAGEAHASPAISPVHTPTASLPSSTTKMEDPSAAVPTSAASLFPLQEPTSTFTLTTMAIVTPTGALTPTRSLPKPTQNPGLTPAAAPPSATPAWTPSATQSADPWPYSIDNPPQAVGGSAPVVYETSWTINTYDYEAGFVDTGPDDPVYPYPRLDFARVGGSAPRAYRAVVLENGFVRVTVLPELGGRIIDWLDKSTGRQLLYQNPVVKPTSWGYRGWWLAAGGIEWAFPVEEHGLNEWCPWQVNYGQDGGRAWISITDTESRTGMAVGATISLNAYSSHLVLEPWARNDTDVPHDYQLWLNAMLTLGGNRVSPSTRFVLPTGTVTVHSTADGGAPGPGGQMAWPVHGGRDMSRYGNWTGYLGFFAPAISFSGLYDPDVGQGIVRTHARGWPIGTKFFGPATLSPSLWTDGNTNYVELWSGATSSFWTSGVLAPGQSVGWTERWYPIGAVGAPTMANGAAAVRVSHSGGQVEIAAATARYFDGTVELLAGGVPVAAWSVTLSPGQVFRTGGGVPAGTGPLILKLTDSNGVVLTTIN